MYVVSADCVHTTHRLYTAGAAYQEQLSAGEPQEATADSSKQQPQDHRTTGRRQDPCVAGWASDSRSNISDILYLLVLCTALESHPWIPKQPRKPQGVWLNET